MRLAAALLAALIGLWPGAAGATDIALLDPDANLASLRQLRAQVADFLRGVHPALELQPFVKAADLERFVAERPVPFAILAEDAAEPWRGRGARPLLIALRGGRPTYTKVLVVRRGTTLREGSVIASTATVAQVRAIPAKGPLAAVARARVLRVSKEIDALLGMTFGRADAAYVTPETLAQLGRFDPDLAASLEEIHRSQPIKNAQLYALAKDAPQDLEKQLVEAFLRMDRTPSGRAALQALGYSGWRLP